MRVFALCKSLSYKLTKNRSWPDLEQQPKDDTILRHAQIELRKAELEAVVQAIQRLASGETVPRYSMCSQAFDWTRFQKVDATRPIIIGHSLGGSAAVSRSYAISDETETHKSPSLHLLRTET